MRLTAAEQTSIQQKAREVAQLAKRSVQSMHDDREVEAYLEGLLMQFAVLRVADVLIGREA